MTRSQRKQKNNKKSVKSWFGYVTQSPARAMLLALILAVAGYAAVQISNAATDEEPVPAHELAAERIIIRYRDSVSAASAEDRIETLSGFKAQQVAESQNLRMKVFKAAKTDRAAIIEKLKADPSVLSAEPDQVETNEYTTPTDTRYSDNFAFPVTATDMLWDKHKGSSSMIVAVIDSGANMSHPELAGKLVQGKDYVNNDNDPQDDEVNSHGSMISGIIAANTNNGVGIAGGCWECKIMPLKTQDKNGNGLTSNVILAIDYAVANGAKIINKSSGRDGTPLDAEKAAIDNAVSKGVMFFSSAGNKSVDEAAGAGHYPGLYPNAISVGYTKPDDTLGAVSNFGSTVDITAPGKNTGPTATTNDYITAEGTSQATPVVAAVAAVLRSAFPNATVAQVRDALTSTTDPCCGGKTGGGRLNAIKAYNKLAGLTTDTAKPTVSLTTPASGLSVSGSKVPFVINATDNVGIEKVHYILSNNKPLVTTALNFTLNFSTVPDNTYPVQISAYDKSGNMAAVNSSLVINNTTRADTTPPTLSVSAPAEGSTLSGTGSPLTATATDNKSIAWVEFKFDDLPSAKDTTAPYGGTFSTTTMFNGVHKLVVTAMDSTGNTTVVTRNFSVNNSTTPNPTPNPPGPTPNPPGPTPNPPGPTPNPPNPTPKPGDLNNDGKVNIADLSTLLSNWGKTGTNVTGDINKDGKVNISDLSTLLSNWSR